MKKLPLSLLLLLLPFIIFSQKQALITLEAASNETNGIEIKKGFNDQVYFEGSELAYINKSGDPDIPFQLIRVLLPADCDIRSVSVDLNSLLWKELENNYSIAPAPPAATKKGEALFPASSNIVNGKNSNVYENPDLYPGLESIRVKAALKGSYKVASFYLPLYRYSPTNAKILSLAGGMIYLHFQLYPQKETGHFFPPLDDAVLCPQQSLLSYPTHAFRETRSADGYIILTTNSIASNSFFLDEFINAKSNMGYDVTLVTEDDWGGGSGDPAAENIKTWLTDNYTALNIKYLLLIGNPNPSSGDVPMKMLWPRKNATYYTSYKSAPSDFYYTDMTGNWDLDGDGYYGEWWYDTGSGGCERTYEIFVGRIPHYGDSAVLDNILNKLIAYTYEPASMSSWRKSVILPMEPSDDNTPGYHLGEAIRNDFILTKPSWSAHRIYEDDYGLADPPETTPCNYSNVYNSWIGSQPGAAFWWTHGSSTTAADIMNTSYAAQLNDSLPAFTFQCSCNNSYPESSSNLSFSLLKNGSPGTVGATRVSWYYQGQTNFNNSGSNSGMTYDYAERLIGTETQCGYALQNMKEQASINSDALWMNCCVFNLYGDPSLQLIPYCHDTLIVENTCLPSGEWRHYESSAYISLADDTTTYILEGDTSSTGAIVSLNSADCIRLKPGFHAKEGSQLNVWIGGGCSASMLQKNNNLLMLKQEGNKKNEDTEEPDIQVFPNPTKGPLNIMLPQEKSFSYQIFTVKGEIIENKMLKGQNNVQTNLNELKNGIYFIRINTNTLSSYFRIIKI